MKNNIILDVKSLKKLFKGMLFAVAICASGAVFAKPTGAQAERPQAGGRTASVKGGAKKPVTSRAKAMGTITQATSDHILKQILDAPIPWTQETRNRVSRDVKANFFSEAQKKEIKKRYDKSNALAEQQQQLAANPQLIPAPPVSSSSQGQLALVPQQAQVALVPQSQQLAIPQAMPLAIPQAQKQLAAQPSSFSVVGAASGGGRRAAAVAYYGGQKVMEGLGGIKAAMARAYYQLTGNYESSISPGYKLAAATAAFALAPYLGVTAALTAAGYSLVTTGIGLGAGTYALTSVLDRLEYAYQTGGNFSEDPAIKELKELLKIEIINNAIRYPSNLIIADALKDGNELYGLHEDKFGLLRKAHDALAQEYQTKWLALDADTQKLETDIVMFVRDIRTRGGYDYDNVTPESLQQYADIIKRDLNWAQCHAVLSEYYRALQKKKILEEKAKQPAQAIQAPQQTIQTTTLPPQIPLTPASLPTPQPGVTTSSTTQPAQPVQPVEPLVTPVKRQNELRKAFGW